RLLVVAAARDLVRLADQQNPLRLCQHRAQWIDRLGQREHRLIGRDDAGASAHFDASSSVIRFLSTACISGDTFKSAIAFLISSSRFNTSAFCSHIIHLVTLAETTAEPTPTPSPHAI